jgi:Putative Actinobacterial Holin-X, holin superfamily III
MMAMMPESRYPPPPDAAARTAGASPFGAAPQSGSSTTKAASSAATDPCGRNPRADAPKIGPDALKEALGHVAQAKEYVGHLASAELDRFKLKIRRALMWAAAGVVALMLGLSVLVPAAFLLLAGISTAIGNLLGHAWIGDVIVGGGILALTALGVWLGLRIWQKSAFKALKARYEARKRRQRVEFGRSVDPQSD